jgi:hypothetical protein
MRDITIQEILQGSHQSGPNDSPRSTRSFPETVLGGTLQDLLLLFVSGLVCDCAMSETVPPGFATRFVEAMAGTTPGKLLPFATWLATAEPSHPALSGLRNHLLDTEKKPTGWLSQLAQLRNRWAHPEGTDPEEALTNAGRLLESVPPGLSELRIRLQPEGTAALVCRNEVLPLSPFASSEDDHLLLCGGFERPDRLVVPAGHGMTGDRSVTQDLFRVTWRRLRALDMSLGSPTPEDFQAKATMASVRSGGDIPWWTEELWRPGSFAFLVPPGHSDGILESAAARIPVTGRVRVVPGSGQEPTEALAQALGLAAGPMAPDLLSFLGAGFHCVLTEDTSGLSAKDFLQHLYWAADLTAAGNTGSLRLVIEREGERLAQDQEKLWDRLPERLETILRKPPGCGGGGLTQYLWPAQKPKKRFGLF